MADELTGAAQLPSAASQDSEPITHLLGLGRWEFQCQQWA